jgi:hypothetical protein
MSREALLVFSPLPSWGRGVQSGPEPSRARRFWARHSEPLTARAALKESRQEGKGIRSGLLSTTKSEFPKTYLPLN